MTTLVASSPAALQRAQQSLLTWAQDRRKVLDAERAEAEESIEAARRSKWRLGPFRSALRLIERQQTFISKIEDALHAGYLPIPNMNLEVFAVRTDQEASGGDNRIRRYRSRNDVDAPTQAAGLLPSGEGENVSPTPRVVRWSEPEKDAKGEDVTRDFVDVVAHGEIVFPMDLAKPVLMDATNRALSLKLFDELGVARDWNARRGDPYIVGRILNPHRTKPHASFFVAWGFDPESWT